MTDPPGLAGAAVAGCGAGRRGYRVYVMFGVRADVLGKEEPVFSK